MLGVCSTPGSGTVLAATGAPAVGGAPTKNLGVIGHVGASWLVCACMKIFFFGAPLLRTGGDTSKAANSVALFPIWPGGPGVPPLAGVYGWC